MFRWFRPKLQTEPVYIIHVNVCKPSGKKVRIKNPTINYYGKKLKEIEIKVELIEG